MRKTHLLLTTVSLICQTLPMSNSLNSRINTKSFAQTKSTTSISNSKKQFMKSLASLETEYKLKKSASNRVIDPTGGWGFDTQLFYSDFPYYNEGGERINSNYFNKTLLSDISSRYNPKNFHLVDSFDFARNKPVVLRKKLIPLPEPEFGSEFNLQVRPSYELYLKNNVSYSPCVTAAGISILNSMAHSHGLTRPSLPSDVPVYDPKSPYILKSSIGGSPASNTTHHDPFSDYFTSANLPPFTNTKYKNFTLVQEDNSDPYDIGYVYNQNVKMAAVVGGGGNDYINGLNAYLKENSLSENKNHRYIITGTRQLISSRASFEGLIDYLNISISGALGGDNDFKWPDYISTNNVQTGGGHAFIIVGYGITKKLNVRTNQVVSIPEIVYNQGNGLYSAMPAFDLCDWFDLTIKPQNKEFFGWRTSTDPDKSYRA